MIVGGGGKRGNNSRRSAHLQQHVGMRARQITAKWIAQQNPPECIGVSASLMCFKRRLNTSNSISITIFRIPQRGIQQDNENAALASGVFPFGSSR